MFVVKSCASHEIAQLYKIAEPILRFQERIVNDEASAKFLRPPGNVSEHESDEHNEGNNGAEMVFDIVEALAYRLVNVNHVRACAEENGSAIMLDPKEHGNITRRDDSRKLRFVPACVTART